MTPESVGLASVLLLTLSIAFRVPIAVAMGLTALLGYATLESWPHAMTAIAAASLDIGASYTLSVVPLFLLMGTLGAASGLSSRLLAAADALFAGIRGSAAMATIGACAIFGAICGSSLATTATIGRIAIPELRKASYDDRLMAGSIAAGGTLGILIPPSIIFVLYAIITQQSVAKLFAAGLIPGLILTSLYIAVVRVWVWIDPSVAPEMPKLGSKREQIKRIGQAWEAAFLFGLSIGGIYLGWFTPTEAAAVGAAGALFLGLARRRLRWAQIKASFKETLLTSASLFMIVIAATMFAYFAVQSRIPETLVTWVGELGLPPMGVMLALLAFYIVAGCFVDGIGMILITVPVFYPLVVANGFDPIWFGVILVVVVELGLIHPPVGMNIFVLKAQAPDLGTGTIIKGVLPFLAVQFAFLGLLLLWPDLALWLPRQLFS
ncbi:TRAP transporter large permease [Microvirga sp. 2YAF29]|uniref:TRAP transporter large permease n=1 Tax=Microvirga sp. 2YAF29 TaxID=3233031 RepID=UPI003F9D3679